MSHAGAAEIWVLSKPHPPVEKPLASESKEQMNNKKELTAWKSLRMASVIGRLPSACSGLCPDSLP